MKLFTDPANISLPEVLFWAFVIYAFIFTMVVWMHPEISFEGLYNEVKTLFTHASYKISLRC